MNISNSKNPEIETFPIEELLLDEQVTAVTKEASDHGEIDNIVVPSVIEDVFTNLEAIRIDPASSADPSVVRITPHIPIRKPSKESFIRVHPEYSLDTTVLELKEDQSIQLVNPALRPALAAESCVVVRRLVLGITRQGTPFIWPLRLPAEGKRDLWAMSALDAAEAAKSQWVRVRANLSLGGFEYDVARLDWEPVWPAEPFNELLRKAFKGAHIESLDHPTLKMLRGEA
jgi:hypothetical protein